MTHSIRAAALIAATGLACAVNAQTVSGTTVVKETDALAGTTVSGLGSPFTDGNGTVGFVVTLDDDRRGIWYDTGLIFTSDEAVGVTLSGGESTMGIGNNGEFVYSPSIDDGVESGDGLVSDQGVIATDNQPAEDFAPGFANTFHSRPQMADDGTAYWVSATNDGMGGTSSQNRIIYRRTTDGNVTGILRAGDVVDGVTVGGGGGIDFDFSFSDDQSNTMFIFNDANQAGSADATLTVNGAVIAQEGSPSGSGDNWDNFDVVDINNAGNFIFSGDTDGATTVDEFIAYNGAIQLREGDALAGGVLDGSVDAASINDLNQAVYIWDLEAGGTDTETLFFAGDAADLAGSSIPLLAVGDGWDDTGDGVADWIIDDFNASVTTGPGLELAEDGFLFVEVDLASLDGATTLEAIISVAVPAPGSAGLLALGGLAAARRRR
ncbi:MAG: hypothetical protein AAGF47_08885 [Planctomycetota bacterium]